MGGDVPEWGGRHGRRQQHMVGRPRLLVKRGLADVQRSFAEQTAWTVPMHGPAAFDPYPALSQAYQGFFDPVAGAVAPRAERIEGSFGALQLDRHGPADATLSVVLVLVHGAGGYGRMFAPLAQRLAVAGHEVLAPDLPGYGLSPAPWAQVDYAAWKRALLALIPERFTRCPVLMVHPACDAWTPVQISDRLFERLAAPAGTAGGVRSLPD